MQTRVRKSQYFMRHPFYPMIGGEHAKHHTRHLRQSNPWVRRTIALLLTYVYDNVNDAAATVTEMLISRCPLRGFVSSPGQFNCPPPSPCGYCAPILAAVADLLVLKSTQWGPRGKYYCFCLYESLRTQEIVTSTVIQFAKLQLL